MSNYIGYTPDIIYDSVTNRFFYGVRRTDQGELFVTKSDQLQNDDSVSINKPGDPQEDFTNFEEGQDFFEGRNVNHNLVFENLNYEQFRWDNREIFYYVNSDGELVARVNQKFTYDDNSSSEGIE